jgi:glycosyltransferase involved in cell wall biosynthesis
MRVQRLLRRVSGKPTVPTKGAIERAQSGLVSGWLFCPDCNRNAAVLALINDVSVASNPMVTPRPDVPGGHGYLLRFSIDGPPVTSPVAVRVHCAAHPACGIDQVVTTEQWNVPALGRIENLAWPIVTGWVAAFGPVSSGDGTRIEIDGFPQAAVQASVSRPDVQAFLGSEGVAGFHVDMGDVLGYAVPEGSIIRLVRGGRTLDEVVVTGSPIGDGTGSCITATPSVRARPDDSLINELIRRFRATDLPDQRDHDWLHVLESIGIQDHSASTRQWADYLAAQGLSSDVVAGLLAGRAVQGLRVPVLDPLPADLVRAVATAPRAGLPARVSAWDEGVLTSSASPQADDAAASAAVTDRVCVAGLVQHKSGLGQNANHSLSALNAAGIHACAEPFFPAPGGWNPRLGPDATAAGVMRDHAVLLHAPIDRVVQSLAAQPALLASPRLIGYFMWETAVVPRQLHRSLDLVDEIWTATDFVAEAYRRVSDTPVHVTGHAVDVSGVETVTRADLGIAEDAFVTHFSFDANSTVARKNPNAAIDAFHQAFGDDPAAVFLLKIRNMQQAEHLARTGDPHARGLMQRIQDDSRIHLLTGEWSHARSLGLIQLADCFISLHRSEGFGYAIAEAMALGTPAVATDYSGSTDFLSDNEGWSVPYEPVEVLPEEYFYWEPGMQWAEADVTQAAASLQAVREGVGVDVRTNAARKRINEVASMASLTDCYRSALART